MKRLFGFVLAMPFAVMISQAWAEELTIGGTVIYSVAATEAPHLSRQHMTGEISANDTSSIIHGSKQECFGSFVLTPEQKVVGHGFCDAVDGDGDVWWLTFNAAAESSDWIVVGGTGKFEGMTGSGKTFFTAESPVVVSATAPRSWKQEYEGKLNLPARWRYG